MSAEPRGALPPLEKGKPWTTGLFKGDWEELWTVKCSCGYASDSPDFQTGQQQLREHGKLVHDMSFGRN